MSKRMTQEEKEQEAARWNPSVIPSWEGWEDVPVVYSSEDTEMINLRIPKKMILILTEFARRERTTLEAIIEFWLYDRIQSECDELREKLKGESIEP